MENLSKCADNYELKKCYTFNCKWLWIIINDIVGFISLMTIHRLSKNENKVVAHAHCMFSPLDTFQSLFDDSVVNDGTRK